MITAGDFLAGGGGVTEAMSKIDELQVKFVLNHDPIAIRTNMFNHKGIKHYWSDIYKQDEHDLEKVDFVWASIECTQHSRANGSKEKKIGSYTLGWEFIRYVKFIQPFVIGIENVPEFKDWSPLDESGNPIKSRKGEEFNRWTKTICDLGYEYHEMICNAADYGIPTRRVRYFAFFTQIGLGMDVNWPQPTHHKTGANGLMKWEACKTFIDLNKEGQSIFGRKYNPNVRKGKRNPLSPNTLKRIAGGIKKFAPELHFIFQYYGNGLNANSMESPLNTIPTKDRHALVTIEKNQFVTDHCHTDNYNLPGEPMNPILTSETKQLITVEKIQFLNDYYGRDNTTQDINGPAMTITTENSKNLITVEKKMLIQHYSGNHSSDINAPLPSITTVDHNTLLDVKANLISPQYNSNGNPGANAIDMNDPLWAITTQEKFQFISAFFNAEKNQESINKQSLIDALMNGEIDFDIKMRFLDPEELSRISTFPEKYFTHKDLKLSRKAQTKLIGNAVPPEWARIIIEPVIKELEEIFSSKRIAI